MNERQLSGSRRLAGNGGSVGGNGRFSSRDRPGGHQHDPSRYGGGHLNRNAPDSQNALEPRFVLNINTASRMAALL